VQLSPHFSLSEFTISQTASRLGVDNTPDETVIARLKQTAEGMEEVRDLLGGKPILISSGYRSLAVNRALGSSDTSAHVKGYAVDFICPAFGSPLAICKALSKSKLEFDQIIEEGTWVHISFDPRMRGEVLTMKKGPPGSKPTYEQGLTRSAA
jgi:hypothetical protein